MESKNKNKFKKSSLGLFGLIIICIGIVIVSYDYILTKKEAVFTSMSIKLYENETPVLAEADGKEIENDDIEPQDIENTEDEQPEENKPANNWKGYDYVGILEIPKINLKKGFLDIDSPYNNINYNITVIKSSTYPDIEGGNFILAAHSGASYISYFKHLYKLELGDLAYIYYKDIKYTYKIVDIYNVEKTGQVAIYRNSKSTVLTLITCTKDSDHEQTVYILELTNKEEY